MAEDSASPRLPRELLTRRQVATLLGVGVAKVEAFAANGLMPAAIETPAGVRWRFGEVMGWLHAGCPSPATWSYEPVLLESLREQTNRLRRECSSIAREIEERKRDLVKVGGKA